LKIGKIIGFGLKVAHFVAWGLPAFLVAIPLNYALVEWLRLPKPLAYAFVLVFQVTVNFFICRRYVFKAGDHKPVHRQFLEFFSAILTFRTADWALYSLLILIPQLHYIGVQVFNVLVFAALKYRFSRKIIEGT